MTGPGSPVQSTLLSSSFLSLGIFSWDDTAIFPSIQIEKAAAVVAMDSSTSFFHFFVFIDLIVDDEPCAFFFFFFFWLVSSCYLTAAGVVHFFHLPPSATRVQLPSVPVVGRIGELNEILLGRLNSRKGTIQLLKWWFNIRPPNDPEE